MTTELKMTIAKYKAGSVQYTKAERRYYFREYHRLKKQMLMEQKEEEKKQ